jgi:ribosomal protein S12 methylthiotransferase
VSGTKARGPKVGVISLGCSKNLVDTEVMLGHLDRDGCSFVTDPAEAEVLLVNTCGFIDAAREESIRTVLEASRYRETGKLKRLVVAGCMVQRYAEELRRELPEVDVFLGLDQLDGVVAAARGSATAPNELPLLRATESTRPGPASYIYDDRTPRRLATPRWTAFVKIAEGCDHTCSFCAIPSFRGLFRSRRPESVVAEAESLVAGGVREINLIAQDSSHYGRDLGMKEGLATLLESLDAVPGLRWIRVHYLYPNTVTDHLIETMARLPRVVKYVDMPLQHAHPATLDRMRRGGSAERHRDLLGRFRAAMPDAALRTTFIVGFPGETEEEFEALLDFTAEGWFDHVGVFAYSHEEGTPAHDAEDDVPAPVKRRRLDRLMSAQQKVVRARNASLVGRVVEVLVEGAHSETEHLLTGRMAGQAPEVDGQVLLNDGEAEPGAIVPVEITETAGYDLVGRIVAAVR